MTDTKSDSANDSFLEALGLMPGAAIDLVESKFLEVVRARIQLVAESYDEDAVQAEERTLRLLHEQFFRSCMLWAAEELKKPRDKDAKPDHADALKQKKKAREMLTAMQGQIIEFALCYMHINRFTTLLRDEIKRAEVKAGGTLAKNVKWTSDAGIVMARYKKQRQELLDTSARMAGMRDVLTVVDNDLATMRRTLSVLFGADKAEPYMRKLVAALRTSDFARAQAALVEIADAKKKFGADAAAQSELDGAAQRVIATVQKHAAALQSGEDGKLFLRPIETDVAYNGLVRELRKIRAFLAKYHLPYMEYKLDSLHHLREKLMVVGSLDSLMVLYRRLLTGMVTPMPDMGAARLYEGEVVEKADYMLSGQFQEIPKIKERAAEIVDEFRQNNDEVAASASIDDMEEMLIEVDGQVVNA